MPANQSDINNTDLHKKHGLPPPLNLPLLYDFGKEIDACREQLTFPGVTV